MQAFPSKSNFQSLKDVNWITYGLEESIRIDEENL